MRLSKFLLILFFFTLAALVYVWQQSEIFCLAYRVEKKLAAVQRLADKNAILRYMRESNVSLVRLNSKLTEKEGFQIPETYRLVRLNTSRTRLRVSKKQPPRENIVSRFFSIKRQAEARTIGP